MNIILGATGQVGSHIVKELTHRNLPVRAVVRKQVSGFDPTVEVRTADFFNAEQLKKALTGGTTVFLLTPEDPASHNIIGETEKIIDHYRKAIKANGIKRVVGLSCVGAHVDGNTGNILMSRMLEHGFDDLTIHRIFIRPSYYFSNWLGFLDSVEKHSILPTFFPENLKIDMNSPIDVAKFSAEVIATNDTAEGTRIYELVGPQKYSAREVGEAFSDLLHENVAVQAIPKEKWHETLLSAGFTENTSANLADMTQAVIDNVARPEKQERAKKLATTLHQYLKEQLRKG